MFLARVKEGLRWRYFEQKRKFLSKRYLRQNFSNADDLIRTWMTEDVCDRAVLRDGLVLRHPPGRSALTVMILEVWFHEVYTRNFYTPRAGDIVIDAGANIGLFTLLMARREPRCRVLAYEPFRENFEVLNENVAAGGLENVQTFRAALAGHSGKAAMLAVGTRSQDHRVSEQASSDGDAVATYSFADLISSIPGERVAMFKCDIEGAERQLFATATTADLTRVDRFAIECHDNIKAGTLQLVEDRLRNTHRLRVDYEITEKLGMLYATRLSQG